MAVAISKLGFVCSLLRPPTSNFALPLQRTPLSPSFTSRRNLRSLQPRSPRTLPAPVAPSPHDHREPDLVRPRWKPLCLYHTQRKCALMSDPGHNEKFNHDILLDLQVNEPNLDRPCSDDLDTLLVLDLEGKVEIIEFPVLMMDAKSLNFVDFFHRFVRPVRMDEHKVDEYIQGKYGAFGVDRVWHDTAIPFEQVLPEFDSWLEGHGLLNKTDGTLHRAAFVTCGNWDVKTKIPQQCKDSDIKLPAYFVEWINLKDVYLNFYNREAPGMRSMLQQLGIPLMGSHHLGIDDAKNIARVLQHMILDGCPMTITARRKSLAGGHVQFLFQNRITSARHGRR